MDKRSGFTEVQDIFLVLSTVDSLPKCYHLSWREPVLSLEGPGVLSSEQRRWGQEEGRDGDLQLTFASTLGKTPSVASRSTGRYENQSWGSCGEEGCTVILQRASYHGKGSEFHDNGNGGEFQVERKWMFIWDSVQGILASVGRWKQNPVGAKIL